MLGYYYSVCPWLISVCPNVLNLFPKMCTECGESWVTTLISIDSHPHTGFWGHGLINVIWCFCLEKHLLAPHAVFTHCWFLSLSFYSVLPQSLPHHNMLLCKKSDYSRERVNVHREWTPGAPDLLQEARWLWKTQTVLSYGCSKKSG